MCAQGEFGNEYRVVTAAWYMMMLPFTTLRSHLIAPDDASKAAWDFQEREYERRRVMGTKWRTIREDETVFDEERAKSHPYELGQTRRRTEITISIPVPPKTKAYDVRVRIKKDYLFVNINTHPLRVVIDGELYKELHVSDSGSEWHVEGEFETRRVVLDLDKERMREWPCLLKADAPEEVEVVRPVLSGANGEVDVYADPTPLMNPQRSDKFFSWGEAPPPSSGGARSLGGGGGGGARSAGKGGGLIPSKGGGLPPTKEEAARLDGERGRGWQGVERGEKRSGQYEDEDEEGEGEGVKLESNTALPSGGKEEVDVSAEGEEAESHRQSEVSSLLRGMKVKSE